MRNIHTWQLWSLGLLLLLLSACQAQDTGHVRKQEVNGIKETLEDNAVQPGISRIGEDQQKPIEDGAKQGERPILR